MLKDHIHQKLNITLKDGCFQPLGLIHHQPWATCCLLGLKGLIKSSPLVSQLSGVCLVAVQECGARARQEGLLPRAFSKVCNVVWFCQRGEEVF